MNGFAQAIAHNKGRWFKSSPRNHQRYGVRERSLAPFVSHPDGRGEQHEAYRRALVGGTMPFIRR
jgi:hypothetical protein